MDIHFRSSRDGLMPSVRPLAGQPIQSGQIGTTGLPSAVHRLPIIARGILLFITETRVSL